MMRKILCMIISCMFEEYCGRKLKGRKLNEIVNQDFVTNT